MTDERVRIIPLGGVGEVGKNSTVIETDNDIVVVDAGLMFPEEDMLGIDLVIPDMSYLRQRRDKIRAIVVTHGHEDHTGALPYILEDLNIPIYATKLTLGLIRVKLEEHSLSRQTEMIEMRPGEPFKLGGLTIEAYRVSHSIPDAVGLAIHTPVGTIVHSGDFKFDPAPVDKRPTDYAKLAQLGTQGVLCLISDCVRVESPGHTPSEQVVRETFDRIFSKAPGRIIITTFASNISRVQQVVNTAYNHGRKVAVVGRSMENNVNVAIELGYLDIPKKTLLGLDEINRLSPTEVVIVTTGSQGEPSSVLSRIATNDHKLIRIIPGDTVIISATPVPGNEETVNRTISNLFKLDADVIYSGLDTVHVSGHASQEELKLLLNLLRPRYCVPFHGDYRHMVLYKRLATEVGIPPSNIFLSAIGDVIELGKDFAAITDRVPSGSALVDGMVVGEAEEVILRDRYQLAKDGIVMVAAVVDRQTGQIVGEPEIASKGFFYTRPQGRDGDLMERAKEIIVETFKGSGDVGMEYGLLMRKIRQTLGRYLYQQTKQRPMILPVITEI